MRTIRLESVEKWLNLHGIGEVAHCDSCHADVDLGIDEFIEIDLGNNRSIFGCCGLMDAVAIARGDHETQGD